MDSLVLPYFPHLLIAVVAGLEETKKLAGNSPPSDSDPFNDAEFSEESDFLVKQAHQKRRLRIRVQSALGRVIKLTNYFCSLKATVASGGKWIRIDCSRPIQGTSWVWTPPKFPTLLPP